MADHSFGDTAFGVYRLRRPDGRPERGNDRSARGEKAHGYPGGCAGGGRAHRGGICRGPYPRGRFLSVGTHRRPGRRGQGAARSGAMASALLPQRAPSPDRCGQAGRAGLYKGQKLRRHHHLALKIGTGLMRTKESGGKSMSMADALARLPFWGLLTVKEQGVLAARAVIRRDGPGQIVHGGQHDCPGLFLVLSGELRAAMLSEAGREITLYRVGTGEFCVLSASCVISQITFDTQIMTESSCECLVIDTATINGLAEKNLALRCALYEQALRRFSEVMWTMQQILFMGLDCRLATFLIGETDRTDAFEIVMTHDQIARHISSAREVVARMLKRFAAEGWVQLHRGRITVTNPGALRRLAAAEN